MEKKFVQADSGNLPKVDPLMVAFFFKNNPDFYVAELKNVKTAMSGRESYGDDAIGFVQLHRNSGICTIKCKMCPEHKVRNKAYNVTMVLNENEGKVVSCMCHDCAASAGGCKHAVAFLMWLHRRSEEPACTSVNCYWKKPGLSRVGSSLKYITLQQMCKKKVEPTQPTNSPALLNEFLSEAKKRNIDMCELLKYQPDFQRTGIMQFSMHHFMMGQPIEIKEDMHRLLDTMKQKLNTNIILQIEEATRQQSKSSLWYEMKYGRITASKAHEASVCHTTDGSLVAAMMGAKIPDTAAMKRGRKLELAVRKTVEYKLKKQFTPCGLFVCKEYLMVAASPDGLCKDAVIEIKCPTSEKTKENYVKNGVITDKFKAQVQIQMFASNMKKCYFCVADNNYEHSKNVEIIVVTYDHDYVIQLLNKLSSFWIKLIYPILKRNTNLD